MAKRPCLDCGSPTTGARCKGCGAARDARLWAGGKGQRYDTEWRKFSREAIARHVEVWGWMCPGFEVEAHASRDLVTDHDLGPMCRGCNSRKAATVDKQHRR